MDNIKRNKLLAEVAPFVSTDYKTLSKLTTKKLIKICRAYDGGWHNCEFGYGSTFYNRQFRVAVMVLVTRIKADKFKYMDIWFAANEVARMLKVHSVMACRGGLIDTKKIMYILGK